MANIIIICKAKNIIGPIKILPCIPNDIVKDIRIGISVPCHNVSPILANDPINPVLKLFIVSSPISAPKVLSSSIASATERIGSPKAGSVGINIPKSEIYIIYELFLNLISKEENNGS